MAVIRVDKGKCQGHALCYAVDPDLYPLDDDGFSALTIKEIDDTQLADAKRGVEACPERAIVVEN
jgi:ferredoxin